MQEQIDNIMDNFDFSRVLKAMRALNWEWGHCGSEHEPDEAELRREARRLLKNAWDHSATFACGGFWAYFADGVLSLHFTVSDWCGDN